MAIYDRERYKVVLPQLEKRLEHTTPTFINVSNHNGCVVIGDLAMVWGYDSVTSGTNGTTSGSLTTYSGSATLDWNTTYGIKFKYDPSVSLTWSGNYGNIVALNTYSVSTTSATIYGRMTTSNTSRNFRWFVCGKIA